MTKEQLLAEVDDILRTTPSVDTIRTNQHSVVEWVGRAAAALTRWDATRVAAIDSSTAGATAPLNLIGNFRASQRLGGLLQQARADLRMDVGPLSVVVSQGQVFDYFDEIRKVVETVACPPPLVQLL
jgi:hypothetical protein